MYSQRGLQVELVADPEYLECVVLLESGGEDLGSDRRDAVVGDVEMAYRVIESHAAAERRRSVVRQTVVRQIHTRQRPVHLHSINQSINQELPK